MGSQGVGHFVRSVEGVGHFVRWVEGVDHFVRWVDREQVTSLGG